MRVMLTLGCTAALIAVAACNREEAPAANQSAETTTVNESATNETANAMTPAQIAALIHDRHERYEEIGDAMKAINREMKGGSPSAQTIQRHAALIDRYARQVPSWFPTGSGPETGERTRAKAEIWSDAETFRQRAVAFQGEAARFNQAAQTGDIAAVRAALPGLADSCKNCHDRFRAPESDH